MQEMSNTWFPHHSATCESCESFGGSLISTSIISYKEPKINSSKKNHQKNTTQNNNNNSNVKLIAE